MLNRKFFLIPALLSALLAAFPVAAQFAAQDEAVPQSRDQARLSFAPVVKKVAPAVVNIYAKRLVASGYQNPFMADPFFRQFFGNRFSAPMRRHMEASLGSGVIVEAQGLIVTNAHVIEGAEEIVVALASGREFPAKIALVDHASDLALLRVDSGGELLPFVNLKPSESLEVGDLVVAIGNPFGVGQTVTSGIISAQGRSSLDINDFNFFIQTDAAINPGNSGGPLVALDGTVIGINTAIFSRSGGSMGIGFAIPSEMVATVIAAEKNGQGGDKGVTRPWLGVSMQSITPDIATSLGLAKPGGALIANLNPLSPLLKAGAKVGDAVIAVNGHPIRDAAEMKFRMATVPVGKTATITILREGKELEINVPAIAPPDEPPRQETILPGKGVLGGVTIANLNPAVATELDYNGPAQGVIVTKVPQNVYMRILSPGDIILAVNDTEVKTVPDLLRVLENLPKNARGVALTILSRGSVTRIFLR